MASNKLSANQLAAVSRLRDKGAVSDDISRVVDYLNNKRASAGDRTNDLIQEIAHRSENDSLSRISQRTTLASVGQQHSLAKSLPETENRVVDPRTAPAFAERYHSFCRELDMLLESFRARIETDKPVKH